MLEGLTERFQGALRNLAGRGQISEENVREAMREVRTALLEADVNLDVVREFTQNVTDKAIGQEVTASLKPADLMVKIVYDELLTLLGPVDTKILTVSPGPTIVLMAGLQGSGKTTTCGKLARHLSKRGHQPMLAAVDLQRPAAIDQLIVIGDQAGVPVYADKSKAAEHGNVAKGAAVSVARAAVKEAKAQNRDILILDTAGRLAIDDELMTELGDVNKAVGAHQIFLVLDSMTGQDAVGTAKAFNERLELDGLILTKFDSDTRGGALLSAKYVTGKPVKFLGTGEKLDGLEEFRPEGTAQRILGAGDLMGLVEQVKDKLDEEELQRQQDKMMKGELTLDDFMSQMGQIRKLGSMSKVMGMIPGMGDLAKASSMAGPEMENMMGRMRAMYDSMTPAERKKPGIIQHSRRRRVAGGSGSQPADVNQFLKQFDAMRGLSKQMSGGGMGRMRSLVGGLMGGGLGGMAAAGQAAGGGGNPFKAKGSTRMQKKDRNKKKGRRR
ncbi:MAG: signal recognition particle protein [Planctomycetota bacterium]